ncbi:HTTM domain-containing protein [Isoptericola halotolerans]|uniref:HTTM domain-containing protein n=1 Tax=Isoptericola halotolerans TaxID=300560 RepID=UPI00388EC503
MVPRWTAPLHFWLTLSFSSAITLPDGGEYVAQIVTMFLVLVCVGDRRWWHWRTTPQGASPYARAVGWAGHWGIRIQMAFIYIYSALAKLPTDHWTDGTAMYYVARGAYFGNKNFLEPIVLWATSVPVMALCLAWGTLAAEVLLGVCILSGSRRLQRVGLVVCVSLHVAIIAVIGLFSFGMVMMASVLIATSRSQPLMGLARRAVVVRDRMAAVPSPAPRPVVGAGRGRP